MPSVKEIEAFISLKRASKEIKDYWKKQIRAAALNIIERYGEFQTIENITTKVKSADYNSLSIMLTTPFNKLEIYPTAHEQVAAGIHPSKIRRVGKNVYMLDIWKGKKVFSAIWEPLEAHNFNRGDWLYLLFSNQE